jgi:hypothetical protein
MFYYDEKAFATIPAAPPLNKKSSSKQQQR